MRASVLLVKDFTCKLWFHRYFKERLDQAAMNSSMMTLCVWYIQCFLIQYTTKTKNERTGIYGLQVLLSSSLDENLSLSQFLIFVKFSWLNWLFILLLIILLQFLQTLRYLNITQNIFTWITGRKKKRVMKEYPTDYHYAFQAPEVKGLIGNAVSTNGIKVWCMAYSETNAQDLLV